MIAPEGSGITEMGEKPATRTVGRRRRRSRVVFGLALMIPALAFIFAVSLYPMIRTFQLSTRNTSLGGASDDFVGGANFQQLIADGQFWNAWAQTLQFTVVTVAAETILGLVFALVLHHAFPGRGMLRAAVLIPWAIPTVVTSRMFGWLFDGQNGVVNYLLTATGITNEYVNFLGSESTAMWTIIFADVWKTTPFMALLILAALQTVPNSVLESARVDGASTLRAFWSVRLPMIAPALLIAALLRALDAFRVFDLPYVLTGGGPADSTETLSTLAYKQLFAASQIGYGSALATAMLVSELVLAGLFGLFIVHRYKVLEG